MKIEIEIKCSNEAFTQGNLEIEVSRILKKLSERVASTEIFNIDGEGLKDINGNSVGRVTIKGGANFYDGQLGKLVSVRQTRKR